MHRSSSNVLHSSNLENLFEDVERLHVHVSNNVATFYAKHETLSRVFKQICSEHSTAIGCLDMFNVQINTFLMDIQHIEHMRTYVYNHSYCQYYRIYTTLHEYIQTHINVSNAPVFCNFTKYDYLCPHNIYDFHTILTVHHEICSLFNFLLTYVNQDDAEIVHYQKINDTGINIDPLINNLAYNCNTVVGTYVATFGDVQFFDNNLLKYLKRLSDVITHVDRYIEKDIHIDILQHLM